MCKYILTFFILFLITTCFFIIFSQNDQNANTIPSLESCTLCVCRSSHTVLSRALLCFRSLDIACPGRALCSIFSLLSKNEDWLDPITCCHPVTLPIVFFVGFFCLAISALPELTMWPAMYYLEIKKAVNFLYQY